MTRAFPLLLLPLLFVGQQTTVAQERTSSLRTFGYFQTSFQHWTALDFSTTHPEFSGSPTRDDQNSFSLQQLNLFFSQDLTKHWRAFVDFEILNSFSSQRDWGAFSVEEAWIRYKTSDRFDLKIGLLIPAFNNLNEIKNRTPLLPYVIRPLVYETSFSEFFGGIEILTPTRAYLQASGVLRAKKAKIDYAVFAGNSPNVNDSRERGQTGVDTTSSVLVGARVGVRSASLKAGLSATHDRVSALIRHVGIATYDFVYDEVRRIRLGGDLSFRVGDLWFEGEFIAADFADISEVRTNGLADVSFSDDVSVDARSLYGTVGFDLNDRWSCYAGYWYVRGDDIFIASQIPVLRATIQTERITVPTFGITYRVGDRIVFKGQYGHVSIDTEKPLIFTTPIEEKSNLHILSVAASVFFGE